MAAPFIQTYVQKNTAVSLYFPLYAAGTDNLYTGAAPVAADVSISLDGAAVASPAAAPVQIGASGFWAIALIAAELNGDRILLKVDNAGVDPLVLYIDTIGGPLNCLEGAEPTAAVAANASFRVLLQHAKRRFFNLVTQTVANQVIKRDDNTTTLETLPVSDDGTTQTKGRAV